MTASCDPGPSSPLSQSTSVPEPGTEPTACTLGEFATGGQFCGQTESGVPCSEQNPSGTEESEDREPCPTPLAWQQVLQAFREESTPWELNRGPYTIQGRVWGTGKPLYLLNGLGGTYELFALIVWLLRDDFRCVLYDYPVSPRSWFRPSRVSIEDYANDLLAIADWHGDQRFVLYATSFGTPVGLTAMLQQPQRIERAIFQGGFAQRTLSNPERLLAAVCRNLPGALQRVPGRRVIQEQNHRAWFPPYDITRWQFFLENTGQVPIAALAQRGAALKRCDLRSRLGEITTPVLLVRSEGEGLVSARCHEELESGLPNARTEWLHTSGHLPYLTHPHRLSKLVQSFLLEKDDTQES